MNCKLEKKELYHLIGFIFALALALVAVVTLSTIFYKNAILRPGEFSQTAYPPIPIKYSIDTIRVEQNDTVPVLTVIRDARYDSLYARIAQLEAANEIMAKRQEVLVDDIRQEGNNYINKVNGWLGLWIMLIGILCIVLPIIIQYFHYRDVKTDLTNKIKKLEEHLKKTKVDFNSLNGKIAESERLQKGFSLIQVGIDNSLIESNSLALHSYLRTIWIAVHKYISDTVNKIFDSTTIKDEEIPVLQEMILYMSDYKRQLMRIAPRYRRRRFEDFDDILSTLYRQIENQDFQDIEEFKKRYRSAMELFKGLLGISY